MQTLLNCKYKTKFYNTKFQKSETHSYPQWQPALLLTESDQGDGDQGRNGISSIGEGKRIDFHKWHLELSRDDGRSINSFLIDVEARSLTHRSGNSRNPSSVFACRETLQTSDFGKRVFFFLNEE